MLSRLRNPLTCGLDIDSIESITAFFKTISGNPILQAIYERRYRQFLPAVEATRALGLPYVEIGAGPSQLEKWIPGIVKTDVVAHPNVHQVVDAEQLPFAEGALAGLFLTNVLHHLPHPAKFLAEADRVLAPGGRLLMIEPSSSWWQRLATNMGSPYEYNDENITEWKNEVTGRLTHANNSLPKVIFIRDRARFEKEFPRLKIERVTPDTVLDFYLSGGFNYRPFIPRFFFPLVPWLEWAATPLRRWMGVEITIEIRKA